MKKSNNQVSIFKETVNETNYREKGIKLNCTDTPVKGYVYATRYMQNCNLGINDEEFNCDFWMDNDLYNEIAEIVSRKSMIDDIAFLLLLLLGMLECEKDCEWESENKKEKSYVKLFELLNLFEQGSLNIDKVVIKTTEKGGIPNDFDLDIDQFKDFILRPSLNELNKLFKPSLSDAYENVKKMYSSNKIKNSNNRKKEILGAFSIEIYNLMLKESYLGNEHQRAICIGQLFACIGLLPNKKEFRKDSSYNSYDNYIGDRIRTYLKSARKNNYSLGSNPLYSFFDTQE